MKSLSYFYINNGKFNYNLKFYSNQSKDSWKLNVLLIEYCETVGINIPHYCYHKNLSISGNCRMCLVEVKNSPKPIVSCALSAKSCLNNSSVYTNSPLVKKSRENVLEFLLLNHPLDCPICDQGGECNLQEQSFFFGMSKKRFYNFKRLVMDKNVGLIVKTVMTRCIHCTRCVRFAREIAGVQDLGIFGRGINSEIGTYVQKTFQSELSGNVIELCPVGALTSKLYPFVSRNWELKSISSIDFSDGFGLNINVHLKNNVIIKITPGFDYEENSIIWISDKTRFSFDGMFSPERVLKGFIAYGSHNYKISLTWKLILNEIITTLYFQDHLNKHFLKYDKLILVFNANISLEVLSLIILISKKYSFISLRLLDNHLTLNDCENNLIIKKLKKLENSNLCIIIGLNSRYEGTYLNLKLRQRYLKSNFKIISIGSMLDLTVPVTYLGLNSKHLKSVFEGNHILCREIVNSINPLLIFSSQIYKRKDVSFISSIINFIKTKENKGINYNTINILSGTLNEVGINYLQGFKALTTFDLEKSNGIYFFNSINSKSFNFNKVINLKILNYFRSVKKISSRFCLEHNNSMITEMPKKFLDNYMIYNYINLPNTTFFGSNGTYLNTQGYFKKVIKFLSNKKQGKEDWQIIRKIFSYSNQINFLTNLKNNTKLSFNTTTFNLAENFCNFLYFSGRFLLGNNIYCYGKKISLRFIKKKKDILTTKTKLFLTNLKIWIKDFYIGGIDGYSNRSITMINCSKLCRCSKTNFIFIFIFNTLILYTKGYLNPHS